MISLRRRCETLSGWARLVLGGLLGCLAALSLPPVYAVPLLAPSLVGLYWLVRSSPRPRSALGIGWAFGFGFFIVGLYWIGNAFMVYAARDEWLAIPAVVGLSGFLAFYIGLACWVHRHLVRGAAAGIGGVMVFAALWVLSEWFRSWVFTGFPWNLIGSTWAFNDAMIQSASSIGTYGLSLITIFAFCGLAVMGEASRPEAKSRWWPLWIGAGVLVVFWAGGLIRLSGVETVYVPDVRLRLVQPNIPQTLKWKKDLRSGHVLQQLDMSLNGNGDTADTANETPTHVIWAETAIPYVLTQSPSLIDLIAKAVPTQGALITGAIRDDGAGGSVGKPRFWNSLFAIDASGHVVASYDKMHLVPFGEYMPLQDILPLEKLTAGAGQFTPGAERLLVNVPGLPPFSPLICYEIIFPGAVSADNGRPAWLLNLTNDAWYGISPGPYQHFVSARLRAVEEGLPVVRVANTGISGVIDGYGRVDRSLGLGQAGVLDAPLPQAISPTPFALYHNILPGLLGVFFFGAGLALYAKRRGSDPGKAKN